MPKESRGIPAVRSLTVARSKPPVLISKSAMDSIELMKSAKAEKIGLMRTKPISRFGRGTILFPQSFRELSKNPL
jgi:hypothetical protein